MSEYSDIFGEELDHMEGKVHLESDPNVAPTVMLLRHVPVALIEKLKNEIDCLTQRKVISPIQEPTDWISSMIAAKKPDGNIHLCIDPHYLKSSLKWKPLPSPRDRRVISNMHNHPCFTCVNNLSRFKST